LKTCLGERATSNRDGGYIELTSGRFDDFVEDAGTVADEIGDWQRGDFPYRGEVLRVNWLDDEESRRVRAVFGLDEDPLASSTSLRSAKSGRRKDGRHHAV